MENERLNDEANASPAPYPEDLAEIDGAIPAGVDILDSEDAAPAVIRGGTLRTLGYGAGVLLGLAAVPLLIRHLGTDNFGRYTVVVSLVALVAGLTDGGLVTIGLREFSSREGAVRDSVMRNLLGVRVMLALTGIAAAVCFAALAGYDSTMVWGTLLAGLGQLVLGMHNIYSVPLQSKLRFGWVAASDLMRVAVQVVLIVVLVIGGAGLIWFLGITWVASLVAIVPIVWLARRLMPMLPAFHPGVWWPLLKDVLPYSAAIAVQATYFRIAVILMSLIATTTQTGYFSASFRVIEVLVAIPVLVIGAVFPVVSRAAHTDRDRFLYVMRQTFDVAVIFGVWVALAVSLGASFIIDVIAGPGFGPSVTVLQIQSVAVAATFIGTASSFALLAVRRHTPLLVASSVALVLSAALTLILVPPLEERGAAIATAVAEVGLAIVVTAVIARKEQIGYRFGTLGIAALGAGLGACTALVPGLPDVARAVIASAIFFAVIALTGRIPVELTNLLRAGLARVGIGGRAS